MLNFKMMNGVLVIDVNNIKFGLDTIGDVALDGKTGERISYEESIRNIVEEGKLAEEVGMDILALGEHHRVEYSISSPKIILAALASVTSKITLGTGGTVLSSDYWCRKIRDNAGETVSRCRLFCSHFRFSIC